MTRWIGLLLVMGTWTIMGWCPAAAKDHSAAKSLVKTGIPVQVRHARSCGGKDLLGNWELVRFDSTYRFKKPQAPYLYPHQVFQYSNEGGVKSAHALQPIVGHSDLLFAAVPLTMMYHVERRGRVLLNTRDHDEPVETWVCEVMTQDRSMAGGRSAIERGDLIMTLIGSGGQPLFVCHLRKRAA